MIEQFCSGAYLGHGFWDQSAANSSTRAILLRSDRSCSSLPPKGSFESTQAASVNGHCCTQCLFVQSAHAIGFLLTLDRLLDCLGNGSILAGLAIAYVSSIVFPKSGFGQSATSGQTFSGGCLLQVLVGVLSGFGVSRLLPDDPCHGAFTPDTVIFPLFISLIVAASAIALFCFRIWRKSGRGDRLDP